MFNEYLRAFIGPLASPFIHALTPFFAVDSNTPDGPASPGVTTPAGQTNQFAVSAMVFGEKFFRRWVRKDNLAMFCERRIEEVINRSAIGDTVTVVFQGKRTVTTGKSFQGQARQKRTGTVVVGPVRGIHDSIGAADEPLYMNPNFESEDRDTAEGRFIAEINKDIATEKAEGYSRGQLCLKQTTRGDFSTTTGLAAPGEDGSNFPKVALPNLIQADFEDRLGTDRKLCMVLAPTHATSFAESGTTNQEFSTPVGQAAWTEGTLKKGMFGGFSVHRASTSVLGSVNFTNMDSAMTVQAAPAEGATTLRINIAAGKMLRKGTKIHFPMVYGVDEVQGERTELRAGWAVTADTATAGTNKPVTTSEPFDSTPQTVADRWRNCDSRPANNRKVYPYNVDVNEAVVRTAIAGRRVTRSLLFVDKSAAFVMVPIRRAKKSAQETSETVRVDSLGVVYNYIEYDNNDELEFRTRIDGRWGQKVLEPEAGWVVCGNLSYANAA